MEDDDVDFAGVPYFRAHDSLFFKRIAKYFVDELEDAWHNTEINPIGKVFDSTSFINEFDAWQNQIPEELWRIAYERQYKRTYVGGTGVDWDNAVPQNNQANTDIASTRFLEEMMNGRKKYQRRCFERNQEIFMSSKFKGEVNLNDTITLRGTGTPTGKVVPYSSSLNIVPFSKMYINLYNTTDGIYYHHKHESGEVVKLNNYPGVLDNLYIRGASQIQSLGDLSPMYLQTAELTSGAKLKTITLGNATTGYSNDSLRTLQIGASNKLLEELDIRNLSNLNKTDLPVSNIPSLKRVYAQGSNISEASFANNGLLEEAYLPETLTRLELRNLHYLNKIELESYGNLLHLVAINCPTMNDRILEIINQASELKTLRVTNVDWRFDNTDVLERLYGLIKNFDSPEVVLSGNVHVHSIKESEYNKYKNVWSDLTITYDEWTSQYLITFVNDDENETVLYTQWVDEKQCPVDPVSNNLIPTPTKQSTVSTSYTYLKWNTDKDFSQMEIYGAQTFKAVYTESLREYKIQYKSMGIALPGYETPVSGYYGDNIPYVGEIPTYTNDEEKHRHYYLFNRWDKSGFLLPKSEDDPDYVNGVKIVEAIFDDFQYRGENSFVNEDGRIKEIGDLKAVEIYALTKLTSTGKTPADFGMTTIDMGDPFTLTMGYDIDFDDIESDLIIDNKVCVINDEKYKTNNNGKSAVFTGSNYIDTGIKLFDEDKDFVLALDYKISSELPSNAIQGTLMQCFTSSGTNGFILTNNKPIESSSFTPKFAWGSSTMQPSDVDNREMLVIRHKKGDNNLYVYTSNLDATSIGTKTLEKPSITKSESTLVLGAAKMGQAYNNYCIGDVYWCKVWYQDLGDQVCRQLVGWTHEKITLGVSACISHPTYTYRYSLYDEERMPMVSLVASHLLDKKMKYNQSSINTGGWANSYLNQFLNTRFYEAIPVRIKSLLKKVRVASTKGNGSKELSESGCYISVPSPYDVDISKTSYIIEASNPNAPISTMQGSEKVSIQGSVQDVPLRKREYRYGFKNDNIDASDAYWLRSPNISSTQWVCAVSKEGSVAEYNTANTSRGVLIEISF